MLYCTCKSVLNEWNRESKWRNFFCHWNIPSKQAAKLRIRCSDQQLGTDKATAWLFCGWDCPVHKLEHSCLFGLCTISHRWKCDNIVSVKNWKIFSFLWTFSIHFLNATIAMWLCNSIQTHSFQIIWGFRRIMLHSCTYFSNAFRMWFLKYPYGYEMQPHLLASSFHRYSG